MIRKIISLLLSLLIFCGNINVVNAENISTNQFNLYEAYGNIEYDNAIKFVYDNGGMLGGEEFNPGDKITVAEVFIILERMYGNPNNLPKNMEGWNGTSTYKRTWKFDEILIKNQYNSLASRKLAAHLIFSILDIESFKNFHIKNDYLFFIESGMYQEDVIDKYTITFFDSALTKAEFCYMLEFIYNNEDKFRFPFNMEKINNLNIKLERFSEDYNKNKLLYFLYKQIDEIPDSIMNKFNERKFKIIIFPSKFKKFYNMAEEYSGMYFDNLREIRLADNGIETFVHEIGHFVGYYKKSYENDLMKFKNTEEYNNFFNVLNSDYYTKNKYEYFAEVFYSYFKCPEILKEHCPLTYDYIDNVIKNFK